MLSSFLLYLAHNSLVIDKGGEERGERGEGVGEGGGRERELLTVTLPKSI